MDPSVVIRNSIKVRPHCVPANLNQGTSTLNVIQYSGTLPEAAFSGCSVGFCGARPRNQSNRHFIPECEIKKEGSNEISERKWECKRTKWEQSKWKIIRKITGYVGNTWPWQSISSALPVSPSFWRVFFRGRSEIGYQRCERRYYRNCNYCGAYNGRANS